MRKTFGKNGIWLVEGAILLSFVSACAPKSPESTLTSISSVVSSEKEESAIESENNISASDLSNAGDIERNPLQAMIDGKLGNSAGSHTSKSASIRMNTDFRDEIKFPDQLTSQAASMERKLYDLVLANRLPIMNISREIYHETGDPRNCATWNIEMSSMDQFLLYEDKIEPSGTYLAGAKYTEYLSKEFTYVFNRMEAKDSILQGDGKTVHFLWDENNANDSWELTSVKPDTSRERSLLCVIYREDREAMKVYSVRLGISSGADGGYEEEQINWMENWLQYFDFDVPVRGFLKNEASSEK